MNVCKFFKLTLVFFMFISSNCLYAAEYSLEDGAKAYVNYDYAKAYKIFEYYANHGHTRNEKALSQGALGMMYRDGHGVKKDRAKAIYWLRKAYNNGAKNAKKLITEINLQYSKKQRHQKRKDNSFNMSVGYADGNAVIYIALYKDYRDSKHYYDEPLKSGDVVTTLNQNASDYSPFCKCMQHFTKVRASDGRVGWVISEALRPGEWSKHGSRSHIYAELNLVANMTNKRAPYSLSKNLEVYKAAVGPGARITFYIKINYPSRRINRYYFRVYERNDTDNSVCLDMKHDFELGATYSYVYMSNDNVEIANQEFNTKRCKIDQAHHVKIAAAAREAINKMFVSNVAEAEARQRQELAQQKIAEQQNTPPPPPSYSSGPGLQLVDPNTTNMLYQKALAMQQENQERSANLNRTPYTPYIPSSRPTMPNRQTPPSSVGWTRANSNTSINNYSNNTSSSNNSSNRNYNQCVHFEYSQRLQTYVIRNSCNVHLMVDWSDQRDCTNASCAEDVSAYGATEIGSLTGSYTFAACLYPHSARNSTDTGKWPGYGQFRCSRF